MASTRLAADEEALLERARRGDERAFSALVAPYLSELHAHCYRVLASFHDAEDALQDTLVRAWRGLKGFEGRSSVRAWVYKIATNAALGLAQRRSRRELPASYGPPARSGERPGAALAETTWLEPYPDQWSAPRFAGSPEARYERGAPCRAHLRKRERPAPGPPRRRAHRPAGGAPGRDRQAHRVPHPSPRLHNREYGRRCSAARRPGGSLARGPKDHNAVRPGQGVARPSRHLHRRYLHSRREQVAEGVVLGAGGVVGAQDWSARDRRFGACQAGAPETGLGSARDVRSGPV